MAIQKIPNTLIADNAVTAAKIANGTLTADDIAANSITGAKISATTSLNLAGLNTTGNVGIGTSTIIGSAANRGVLTLSGASSSFLTFGTGSTRWGGVYSSASNTIFLSDSISTFETGGVERMRIDASGNVTIGSSSLSANAALKFQADTGTFTLEHDRGSHSLTLSDSDGTGEILRIDTSGRLLVGKTSSGVSGVGAELRDGAANYSVTGTSSGHQVALFNRTSSDGDIVAFRKDNTAVGNIGTEGGDLVLGTGTNCGIQFNDGNAALRPFNMASNAPVDNAVDLGVSGTRFKDLYISGMASVGHVVPNTAGTYTVNHLGVYSDGITVNAATSETGYLMSAGTGIVSWNGSGGKIKLGGTAAANELDDYEEGTWNPSFQSDGSTSYHHRVGTYTKVGNLVTAWFHLDIATNGAVSTQSLIIAGIPFAAINTSENYGTTGGIHCNQWSTSTKPDNALITPGANVANLYRSDGQSGIAVITHADIGNGNMVACLTYRAA